MHDRARRQPGWPNKGPLIGVPWLGHPRVKGASTIAAELTVPEKVLLFCVASGTEWARAGVTGATATAMVVKG